MQLIYKTAFADAEYVYVQKNFDDKAILVRSSGEAYLIKKGIGCL